MRTPDPSGQDAVLSSRAMPLVSESAAESAGADLDLDLLDFLQSLTPAERLRRHESALALVRALRKAGPAAKETLPPAHGAQQHGVDPGPASPAR